jgi:hypothetical protein
MNSAHVTAYAVAAFGSVYSVQALTSADISWKDLLGGSAVGAVIFTVVIFLKNIGEMRREHSDLVSKVSTDFSDAVSDATKQFAESTHRIIESSRAHNQANLAMVQQIINDMRNEK